MELHIKTEARKWIGEGEREGKGGGAAITLKSRARNGAVLHPPMHRARGKVHSHSFPRRSNRIPKDRREIKSTFMALLPLSERRRTGFFLLQVPFSRIRHHSAPPEEALL